MSRSSASEAGSLPATLLAAIILAGAIVALFVTVSTGTQSARFDRDFAAAIQVADAGVQQAYLALLAVDEEALEASSPDHALPVADGCEPGSTVAAGVCEGTLHDGSPFRWEYTQQPGRRQWTVASAGRYRDSVRVVQAEVGQSALFDVAILSRTDFLWSGGGTTTAGGACNLPSGPFAIGVGGEVDLTGNTGLCIGSLRVYRPPGTVDPYLTGLILAGDAIIDRSGLDLENTGALAFETGGVCDGQATTVIPTVFEKGDVYCLESYNLGASSDPRSVSGSGDIPATVYVRNDLRFGANSSTNAGGSAGDLLFYVGGTSVDIQSTAVARAAIFAPAADCHSQGGPGSFHGAMTCNDVHLSGNWNYDASVESIGGGDFGIRNWSEEGRARGPAL